MKYGSVLIRILQLRWVISMQLTEFSRLSVCIIPQWGAYHWIVDKASYQCLTSHPMSTLFVQVWCIEVVISITIRGGTFSGPREGDQARNRQQHQGRSWTHLVPSTQNYHYFHDHHTRFVSWKQLSAPLLAWRPSIGLHLTLDWRGFPNVSQRKWGWGRKVFLIQKNCHKFLGRQKACCKMGRGGGSSKLRMIKYVC